MKKEFFVNENNEIKTRSFIPFESHKITVTKDINKTVTPNTISHDNNPTYESIAYLQAVKIVNNKLSSLYRLTGAYSYKRMLTDLYVDRLFIENTETKTQALVDYKARREEIKATLTDTHIEPTLAKALKIERDIISGYIHDIEHDTHNTSKSYDLVMTAYTVLHDFINIQGLDIDYVLETTEKGKDITPYLLAVRAVDKDLREHKKAQQAIKTADKIGVDGLTAKARKEFYNENNNPIRHNDNIECWYAVLTIKEREIIPYLMQGKSEREIADIMGLSKNAIHKRIESIRNKVKQITSKTEKI